MAIGEPKGREFLLALDADCFDTAEWTTPASFVDEFDFPRLDDGQAGGAPDYAVL